MLKAVIDTNLFVSAVISKKGSPARLLQLWCEHAFLVIISEQMVEEIERVLTYPRIRNKYNLKNEEIGQAVSTIKKFAVVLPDVIKLDIVKDDPDDNKVLACALMVKADYIVSGDSHLLSLGVFEDIPIVTVKDFLDFIERMKVDG
ncbi:MAG: putative toxin-antitoxin system toxin component, PIN family [Candidatus Omnitrophica bacterium]|nr:putative toxin-antitoxin system toxin component, PIN family [Candidatus Omnitrophota bacterium]MBU4477887.1 putative toxin-antitoxin system toxin component, PIN family [Candidatus Omnitrophota bacterium]MCG2704217.1 putative toxin-antitoxin system toxin component, PIN family [Candidatus Omnitrophota bacterium]